jgi:hypothetical protein
MMRRLAHEPLVCFLLAGAGLFLGYRMLNPAAGQDLARHVEVTPGDVRHLSVSWRAQGRPAPTPAEMGHLIESWVRDEILFREAVALGLDQNDTIVKRRMVQKMEFLIEDLADLREPARTDLETWFARHADRFAEPVRITFRHLYFSPDRRGGRAQAREAAADALARLGSAAPAALGAVGGDGFMAQDQYFDRTSNEIAKDFGPEFADALHRIVPGSWHGPIESGLGWHVVFIESSTPPRIPAFDEVHDEIRSAWLTEQRTERKRDAYERMRARYEIVLPDDWTAALTRVGTAPDREKGETHR